MAAMSHDDDESAELPVKAGSDTDDEWSPTCRQQVTGGSFVMGKAVSLREVYAHYGLRGFLPHYERNAPP